MQTKKCAFENKYFITNEDNKNNVFHVFFCLNNNKDNKHVNYNKNSKKKAIQID